MESLKKVFKKECKHKPTTYLKTIERTYCLDCNQLVDDKKCKHPKRAIKSLGDGMFKCEKCLKVF